MKDTQIIFVDDLVDLDLTDKKVKDAYDFILNYQFKKKIKASIVRFRVKESEMLTTPYSSSL